MNRARNAGGNKRKQITQTSRLVRTTHTGRLAISQVNTQQHTCTPKLSIIEMLKIVFTNEPCSSPGLDEKSELCSATGQRPDGLFSPQRSFCKIQQTSKSTLFLYISDLFFCFLHNIVWVLEFHKSRNFATTYQFREMPRYHNLHRITFDPQETLAASKVDSLLNKRVHFNFQK